MSATKRAKQSRSHLMGGCATCRRRHVKCDQVKPQCLTCRAIGVTCGGFSYDLRWMPSTALNVIETQSAAKTSIEGTRRHLYTEQSMQSMSKVLAANLIARSVDASLSDIDSRSKNVSNSEVGEISVGPFRVLSLGSLPVEVRPSSDVHLVNDPLSNPEAVEVSPVAVESFENIDDMLDWSDLFALEFPDNGDVDVFQQLPSNFSARDRVDTIDSAECHIEEVQNQPREIVMVRQVNSGSNISIAIDLTSSVCQILLKHYNTHVIPNMLSLPVGKNSPWRILNVNAAVRTLADVTYLGVKDIKNSNLANLFALLAISALDMACNPQQMMQTPAYWQSYSDSAGGEAKRHLQQSLKMEFQGPDKAKYKDQLMTILAMISYSALTNSQTEARSYMIDAERLLRIRGLAKRVISRKARLLHHVYTWFRIVGESTYVLHDYSTKKALWDKASILPSSHAVDVPSTFSQSRSGQNARLDDFLRLEVSEPEDGPDMEGPKGREVGLYDIHLEDPREDPETMHPCIHGVSETWLTLVSQTTRLANVIDSLNHNEKEKDIRLVETLQKRIERLENLVCAFAARPLRTDTSAHRQTVGEIDLDGSQMPIACLNKALNSALIIFFYRRVRNVNPWILQCHVDDVITSLSDFDKTMKDSSKSGYGTVWPAFMAGCEALTSVRRERIKVWIEKGLTAGNSASFRVALETLQELWRLRDAKLTATGQQQTTSQSSSKNGEWTWVKLLKENRVWPMLY